MQLEELQRGSSTRREVGSGVSSFGSRPMGEKTSGDIPRDVDEVGLLTESMSKLDQKLVFEL